MTSAPPPDSLTEAAVVASSTNAPQPAPYSSPRFWVHGDVATLTKETGITNADFDNFSS